MMVKHILLIMVATVIMASCVRLVEKDFLANQNAINTDYFYLGYDDQFHYFMVDYGDVNRSYKVMKDHISIPPGEVFPVSEDRSVKISGISQSGEVVFRSVGATKIRIHERSSIKE